MRNVHLSEIMKGTLQTGNHNNKAAQKGQHRCAVDGTTEPVAGAFGRLSTVMFMLIPVKIPATAKTNAQSCFASLLLSWYPLPLSTVAQMNKGEQSNM